jgi:HPt (histidine-containing phosphotransfer) domain-containing protein
MSKRAHPKEKGHTQPQESILHYLAKNGPKSLQLLQAEYNESFLNELDQLKTALTKDDTHTQREIIHKLLGLCRIQNNSNINALVEDLAARSKQRTDTEELSKVIEELSTQINQATDQATTEQSHCD